MPFTASHSCAASRVKDDMARGQHIGLIGLLLLVQSVAALIGRHCTMHH